MCTIGTGVCDTISSALLIGHTFLSILSHIPSWSGGQIKAPPRQPSSWSMHSSCCNCIAISHCLEPWALTMMLASTRSHACVTSRLIVILAVGSTVSYEYRLVYYLPSSFIHWSHFTEGSNVHIEFLGYVVSESWNDWNLLLRKDRVDFASCVPFA